MTNETTNGPTTVRVSYKPTGFGLALAIDETEGADGVLRVGQGCVTLEIPTIDGRPSVLAWDPAEVDWDSMVA